MNYNNISCLVVGDGIKGMQNQSIALARAIGLKPLLIEVKPFWLTRLFPTLLAGRFSIPLSNNDKNLFSYKSKILLTCGSRMAGISIGLKRYFDRKKINIFRIHIQNPKISSKNFDILVVPEHDNINGNNIILSKGSLHQIKKENLIDFHKKIKSKTMKNLKKHIVILLGGNTKNQEVSKVSSILLSSEIKRIQDLFKCEIVICTSRRTPEFLLRDLKKAKIPKCTFLEPKNQNENIYPGIMFNSKFVLVTSDSINMISEAIGSGKPVFGFDLFKQRGRKLSFIKNLIAEGRFNYSREIKNSDIKLLRIEAYENEADRIGKLIKMKLKSNIFDH